MQTVSYILNAFTWSVIILHTPLICAAFPATSQTLQYDPFCKTELFQAMDYALASLKQYELKKAQEAQAFQENIERLILLLSNNIPKQSVPFPAKQRSKDTNSCKPLSCPEPNCAFRCQSEQGLRQHRTMLHIKKNIERVQLCLPENQKNDDLKKNRCSGCHAVFSKPGFPKHKAIMQRRYEQLIMAANKNN